MYYKGDLMFALNKMDRDAIVYTTIKEDEYHIDYNLMAVRTNVAGPKVYVEVAQLDLERRYLLRVEDLLRELNSADPNDRVIIRKDPEFNIENDAREYDIEEVVAQKDHLFLKPALIVPKPKKPTIDKNNRKIDEWF